MPFPERLREERDRLGLKQEDLADRLNIGRGALSHYERGEREPDLTTLVRMARLFGTTVDYLLCRVDDRHAFLEVPEDVRKLLKRLEKEDLSAEELDTAVDLIQMAKKRAGREG